MTLIPEMALPVETRSASVSVSRFDDPQPSRTIGMIWRKASPLARQLQQIADAVRQTSQEMRARPLPDPSGSSADMPVSG